MITTEIYNKEKNVKRFVLSNANGMKAAFIQRGATITTLTAPDKNGKFENIVIELKDYDEYVKNQSFIGAVPGRFANRIGKAQFVLDGVTYKLNANDNGNCLHGGLEGFNVKDWNVVNTVDGDEPEITFEYLSKDGEENFPGNLTARVTYKLTALNELAITYFAQSDKATPVNLTQHAYFNLSGDFKNQSIEHYNVTINADNLTENAPDAVPTGKIVPVEGSLFDLSKGRVISNLKDFNYDNNYALNQPREGEMFCAGEVYDKESGRKMSIFTDFPGMQFYTGYWLDNTVKHLNGKSIGQFNACCFETQMFPDSPNKPNFPDSILRPGKTFLRRTTFKFSN